MIPEQSQQQADNDFDKQVERAKEFKTDLDTGEGWTQRYHVRNEYNSWSKTFCKEEVPVKALFQLENVPMSADKLEEMIHPPNRKKWDEQALAGYNYNQFIKTALQRKLILHKVSSV